jgi:hypothetical protein
MSPRSRCRCRCVGAPDAPRCATNVAGVAGGASRPPTHVDALLEIWLCSVDGGASERPTHPDAGRVLGNRAGCVVGSHAYRRASDAPQAATTKAEVPDAGSAVAR